MYVCMVPAIASGPEPRAARARARASAENRTLNRMHGMVTSLSQSLRDVTFDGRHPNETLSITQVRDSHSRRTITLHCADLEESGGVRRALKERGGRLATPGLAR